MKIRIPSMSNPCNHESVPVVLQPHNFRFSHAKGNCLYFSVLHYPKKAIMEHLRQSERLEFSITGAMVRAAVKIGVTHLCFVVLYETRENHNGKRYTVTQKEMIFTMSTGNKETDRAEIVQLVTPYISRFRQFSPASAEALIESFYDFADPHPLEDLAERLTNEQKRKAAELLKAYFSA